jgi:hypothetical protein
MTARKTPATGTPGTTKVPAAPKPGTKGAAPRKPGAGSKPLTVAKGGAKPAPKPAGKPAARAPTKPRAARKPPRAAAVEAMPVGAGQADRLGMVAVAAYFRAERRGFAPGGEIENWLEAEAEIERLLARG